MRSHQGPASTVSSAGEANGAAPLLEQDYCSGIASEASSSYPAENAWRVAGLVAVEGGGEGGWRGHRGREEEGADEADLELGLSLGAAKAAGGGGGGPWREYCRILTAKDFPSMVAPRGSPISSSSSSSATSSPSPVRGDSGGEAGRVSGGVTGTKRAADAVSPELRYRSTSQVVGWPPIRAYRMNSLMSHSKDSLDGNNCNIGHHDQATGHCANIQNNGVKDKENASVKEHEKGLVGGSLFVKVKMDGVPIGRKVDVSAHRTYETLALALEDMFQKPSLVNNPIRSAKISKLLDGSSEFVLTYEDKDGDWLLVGDVPWVMFLSTVKRLRIMRTSDASWLAPRCQASRVGLRK